MNTEKKSGVTDMSKNTWIIQLLIGIILATIGWSINRTLNKLDKSIESLTATSNELKIELKLKTSEPRVREIARDVAKSMLHSHLLEYDHKRSE